MRKLGTNTWIFFGEQPTNRSRIVRNCLERSRRENEKTVKVKEMSTKGLQPKLERRWSWSYRVGNANHRNIMTLVDVVDDLRTEQVYLILEYCAGGDLSEFI